MGDVTTNLPKLERYLLILYRSFSMAKIDIKRWHFPVSMSKHCIQLFTVSLNLASLHVNANKV